MPVVVRKDNAIDINTIADQIDNCVVEFFDNRNIDINDISQCRSIPHNIVTLCMRYIYEQLFKPSKPLPNNQKSLLDYNDINQLSIVTDKFLDWCLWFNKSLGLVPFSYMTGIDERTLYRWLSEGEELNPERYQLLKSIQTGHKQAQINLLNDSPVGSMAVANNDHETGLEWSKNQLQQIASNAVYLIPSERTDRLKLDKLDD